jgi:O-antigen ligase
MRDYFHKLATGKTPWEISLLFSLAICLLFSQISISIVQIFLTLALLSWLLLLLQKKRWLAFPSFFWPLLVYAWLSLVSSIYSVNTEISFKDSRELLLYVLILIVFTAFTRRDDIELLFVALLGSGFINTAYSIAYFIFKANPGQRVKGFMGHYMTQAGLLILFGAVAMGFIFLGRSRQRLLWAAGLVLSSIALILTLTRSGWIGLAVALCVGLLLWKPKTLILVPVLAGLVFFISPKPVKDRALSIFSPREFSNMARVEYIRAGVKIIKDFPWLGTGPDTVDMVFQNPKYGLEESYKRNVHLHNNIIQIAAERGIVTLLAWLTFVVTAFVSLARLVKKKAKGLSAPAAGALAALAAFIAAGFFEYNFGDSEVSTLLLFIITIPFALERLINGEVAAAQSASQ